MTIKLLDVSFFKLPMRTRFPFRYGIASLTELPHLFVQAVVEVDGKKSLGVSADGLAPKWFTKNPDTTFEEDDLPGMQAAIRSASDIGMETGLCPTFFDWWTTVYEGQLDWSLNSQVPRLLSGFGFSLIERVVLDAFCRAKEQSLHEILSGNVIKLDLNYLRKLPAGIQPSDFLPKRPVPKMIVRHTIGLADPLTAADTQQGDTPGDGLPFTLQENIREYDLSHFKVKLSGNYDSDHERLKKLARVIGDEVGPRAKFTLDGNENYQNVARFREQWERHCADAEVRRFVSESMLFVEQPIHRDSAFDESISQELADWPDAPPIIIDESDCDFDSLPTAQRLGYSGTSHKNCKGVIKGIVNAASVAQSVDSDSKLILSAEDLANVGPVALLQDLAVVSCLGIEHVERNGHHYFAGLSQLPRSEQDRVHQNHADLYCTGRSVFPAVAIDQGRVDLTSVNRAPFGVHEHPDFNLYDRWEL